MVYRRSPKPHSGVRFPHPPSSHQAMAIFLSLLALLVTILATFFIILEFSVIIVSHYRGAPFVRSRKDRIESMFELADIKAGEFVVDLGSGDGTLVVKAAKLGARAHGVEVDPFLVSYSRWKTRIYKNAKIERENIYNYPLRNADVIFVYLLPETLDKIKGKLEREAKPGTRIISNAFPIPGWIPAKEKNNVFLYHR